ncbi:conserved hypothetical protein, partial [Ricinus communis]
RLNLPRGTRKNKRVRDLAPHSNFTALWVSAPLLYSRVQTKEGGDDPSKGEAKASLAIRESSKFIDPDLTAFKYLYTGKKCMRESHTSTFEVSCTDVHASNQVSALTSQQSAERGCDTPPPLNSLTRRLR